MLTSFDNEIKYCTSCGATNKKSAIYCVECERKINEKHRPFYDFLEKRIKGKVRGIAEAGAFNLVKNFLISHLYGTVLAVSVIATSTVVVATSTPYIKTVAAPDPVVAASIGHNEENDKTEVDSNEPVANEVEETITEQPKTEEETDNKTKNIDSEEKRIRQGDAEYVVSHYYDRVMERMYSHEGYTSDSDTLKLSRIYAENNISGFGFSGVHDMMSKAVPLGMYDETGISYEIIGFHDNTYKFDSDVTSATAKKLYDAGFKVTEANYYISAYRKESDYHNNPSNPQEQEVYRIVLVEHNGEWYIAEDVLISRVKGQTYDIYSQYGPNAIVSYDSDGNVEIENEQ